MAKDETFPEPPELYLCAVKRAHFRRVLEACEGDIEKAARLLGVKPNVVIRWAGNPEDSTKEPPAGP